MFLLTLFIVVLDQLSKKLAASRLKGGEPIVIIKDFFQLSYVENRGAAFGMLQGKKIFFIIISLFVFIAIISILYKTRYSLDYYIRIPLILLLAGSIGNFIDRVLRGYVIDFISFKFGSYQFPLFNIADISIVIGSALLMLFIITGRIELED